MKWLALVIGLYAAACAGFMIGRNDLIYQFDPENYPTSVAGLDVRVEQVGDVEVWVHTGDPDLPVVLYFTGNVGNPGRVGPVLREYGVNGFSWAVMRYQREGVSEGALVQDALNVRAELSRLIGQPVPAERLVLHGHSLGSGIGSNVARQIDAAGLILEAPFTRLCALGSEVFPGLPYCLLSPDHRYATIERIDQIDMPLLVMHGGADEVIPVEMGRAVFEAADDPKQLIVYPEGNHNDLRLFGGGIAARRFAVEVTGSTPR